MPTNFGGFFQQEFSKGLQIGATNYRQEQRLKYDAEKEQRKRQQKVALKNKQLKDYAELTQIPYDIDETTGEFRLQQPPDDWVFRQPDPSLYAKLFPEMGNEYQQAYSNLVKQNQPDYILHEKKWNPETQMGEINAYNRRSGQYEKVADIPADQYVPKKVYTDIIEGQVDYEGMKFGKKGKRTRLIVYDNGKMVQQEVGNIKGRGGADEKAISQLKYELEIADNEERVDNVKARRNTYLMKNFADDEARDVYRDGINSDLNELALDYATLGSDEAQKLILKIFNEGKQQIGKGIGSLPPMSRQQFFEMKKGEVAEMYMNHEFKGTEQEQYQDAQAIYKFLETKYGLYLQYEDSKKDQDDLNVDDILDKMKLE